jgi:hypothetical protein
MNKKWRWVYNPFEQFAGWRAFGIGIVILCIATIIGYFGNTVFYGISIKTVSSVTWGQVFFLQGLGLAVTVFVMWITALLSAKHVRFQDILGTVTLAKYPLVLAAITNLAFSKRLNEITAMFPTSLNELTAESIQGIKEMLDNLTVSDYVLFCVVSIVSILVFVWAIALLFNAFRVSTNLKGNKCTLLFIAIVFISEITIFVILSKIY